MFHIVMHNDTVELFPMLQQCNLNDFCFTGLCSVIKPGHCSKCCFSLCCLTQYRIRYCKQLFSISLEGGSSVCPLFVLPFYLQVGFDQKASETQYNLLFTKAFFWICVLNQLYLTEQCQQQGSWSWFFGTLRFWEVEEQVRRQPSRPQTLYFRIFLLK